MADNYIKNYTHEEISEILATIQKYVAENKFIYNNLFPSTKISD